MSRHQMHSSVCIFFNCYAWSLVVLLSAGNCFYDPLLLLASHSGSYSSSGSNSEERRTQEGDMDSTPLLSEEGRTMSRASSRVR